jgi:hypothetical protein
MLNKNNKIGWGFDAPAYKVGKPYRFNDNSSFLKDNKFQQTPYYFAYGSNLNLEQMAIRCPDAKLVGITVKKDWRLVFRGVADIEKHKGSKLTGGIFKISPKDESNLDRYEGYPSLYIKDFFYFIIDGKKQKVMYYIMRSRSGIAQPSTSYYTTIYNGFIQCGLDTKYLESAYRFTLKNITEDSSGCHFPKKWKKKKKKKWKKKKQMSFKNVMKQSKLARKNLEKTVSHHDSC